MKAVIIFLVLLVVYESLGARVMTFDSFEYSPEESDLIDYGSLRMNKGKNKSVYFLRGNFTIKRTLGNEKLVTFEVLTKNGFPIVRNTYAFCEFTRIEKTIWPELIKSSNMPGNYPCPFPAVRLA